ncbi:hypothetical protein [Turneriella parva]|uniref:Lipoprotein SmpA/OmlA domain-containing protein n=1 Tax=Turneriella parva (strain ATCC BAA-1111 / DSM 21527 / NCTC 11395 / H) TaxID=869212 RepID=I4B277_TURPD|nr:hypothetical protein [Turneriella parva]AFM11384.1 hypothetical protein Turpa_0733 [Turneriella parva DSM 21527]
MKSELASIIFMLSLLCIQCSRATGQNFVRESTLHDFEKIPGMTTEQLIEAFGDPIEIQKRIQPGFNRTVATYYYTLRTGSSLSSRLLSVELKDGKALGYIYSSGFPEDSTRFIDEDVTLLRIGMTEAEARRTIGQTSGRSVMPSQLVDTEFLPILQFKANDRVQFSYYDSYQLKDRRAIAYNRRLIMIFDAKTNRLKDFLLTGKE